MEGREGMDVSPERVQQVVAEVLGFHGAPLDHAREVAEHLVQAERMGVRSHGLLRVSQYVESIRSGDLDPASRPETVSSDRCRVRTNGNRCFGQVAGNDTTDIALVKAETHGCGIVSVFGAGHTGRIGSYTERIAEHGMIGIAVSSAGRRGHRVVPTNGLAPRFATNPIAFAAPSGRHQLSADFATSAAPEGVVRRWKMLGERAPDGVLVDAEGKESNDPETLYENPPGSLLPLGGMMFGHKGYALALMVEVLGSVLGGALSTEDDDTSHLTMIAIAVDADFHQELDAMLDYVLSSPAADPDRPVMLPGERERLAFESSHTLRLDDQLWAELCVLAEGAGVGVADVLLS